MFVTSDAYDCYVRSSVEVMLASLAPALFVFFWSTGFIVARAITPHADAQFFLFCRFTVAAIIWGLLAFIGKGHWPAFRRAVQHLGVGGVMMGLYLCLSFWAVAHGMPVGVMALMGALQPLSTAALMVIRGKESPSAFMWWGQAIGFFGVVLNIGASLIALLAVYTAGAVRWNATPALWGLLLWSVVATSILGQGLLMWMLRRTSASHVTALLLLVPPVAALLAYALFHETLNLVQVVGFVLALTGVVLARRVAAHQENS